MTLLMTTRKRKIADALFNAFFAFIRFECVCLYFHEENIVANSASLKNNKRTNRKRKGNLYMYAKTTIAYVFGFFLSISYLSSHHSSCSFFFLYFFFEGSCIFVRIFVVHFYT
jgi:hypothetical protein